MKHIWTKAAAGLLAVALTAVSVPVNVDGGGMFGDIGIVASAAEQFESIDTNAGTRGEHTYNRTNVTIEVNTDLDTFGFLLNQVGSFWGKISVPNGMKITKLVMIRGWYQGKPVITSTTAERSEDGDTFTFTNVNASSVTLTCDYDQCQIQHITVYYEEESSDAPAIKNASVSLNDGFGLNLYVDGVNSTTAANYKVRLSGKCDEEGKEVSLTEKDGKFYATANVNAKDYKEKITAELYKGTERISELKYSVSDYLTKALADEGIDNRTKAMITASQLYGEAADEYFNGANNNTAARIAAYLAAVGVTDDTAIQAAIAPYQTESDALGTNKVSMVLNSKVKLRVYSDKGTAENSNGKYSEIANLTPVSLGENHTIDGFSVSGYTWIYRILTNSESSQRNVTMAKALFAYMKAAEALNFNIVDLSAQTTDYTAQNGDVLTGKLGANVKISVADGAAITLRDVTIDGIDDEAYKWAGISCEGDAAIMLEGTNIVNGFSYEYPSVFIAAGKTLVIDGTGSLDASSNLRGAGIGGGYNLTCGVTIQSSKPTVRKTMKTVHRKQ